MIYVNEKDNIFHGQTKNTSYIFRIKDERYLEQLYYGKRLRQSPYTEVLYEKFATGYGNSNVTPSNPELTLDNLCLEYSFAGTGDYRHLPLTLQMSDYGFSNNFLYEGYRIYEGTYEENEKTGMPFAKLNNSINDDEVYTLDITLKDSVYPVYLHLIYSFFYHCDVVTRRVKLENRGEASVRIEKVMSMMLDLPGKDYTLHTFDGLWIRERQENRKKLVSGLYVNDSTTGSSSNRHNPFILLTKEYATQETGDCIGCNLIYSGNHYEAVEVSPYGKLRIMTGFNPHQFRWELKDGQDFYTPEAVLTFSCKGMNGMSHNMHRFVNHHIISANWAYTERPILINNWEATYFDFNDRKLLEIAKEAKGLGMEMLVLDDGWFSNRSSDSSSLGDWTVNEEKLGGSLKRFTEQIHEIGLKFGLWFEPEMISEISNLYEMHPDWAVKAPNRETYVGRNQYVLDLTRPEVVSYIVAAVSKVLKSAPIEYVKWDMNRHLSDAYSASLGRNQGEFYHRYILGLYDMLEQITKAFPEILFEGCSAGGNRFDLGILAYMPQIWTSDNTDANQRTHIQQGTSYGYPLSTMTAHVSAVPNHQTLRTTSIETRFHVACFGVLGYEIDITKLTEAEKTAIKEQISFYKQHRSLFQYGTFYRLHSDDNQVIWQVLSEDRKEAILITYQRLASTNPASDVLKMTDLLPEELYEVTARRQFLELYQEGDNIPMNELEEYRGFGDMLMSAGIKLSQQYSGAGIQEGIRIMGDFGTRVYVVKSS